MGGTQLFKTWLFSEPMISRHSFKPSHIVIATLCVDPTITFILEMKEAWFREVRNFTCITQVAHRKSCTLSKENLLLSYTQIFVVCISKEINIKQTFLLEIRRTTKKQEHGFCNYTKIDTDSEVQRRCELLRGTKRRIWPHTSFCAQLSVPNGKDICAKGQRRLRDLGVKCTALWGWNGILT